MTMNELVKTMEGNQEAFKLIKKAQANTTVASIIGGVGGALIGYPLGTALGGGEADWSLLGIGAGIVVIAIPIASNANKNAKNAVELYKASLNPTSYNQFKPKFEFISNRDGLGLTLRF